MKESKVKLASLGKHASKIKISKKLDVLEDTSFFKKKMEKGSKILSTTKLPKV